MACGDFASIHSASLTLHVLCLQDSSPIHCRPAQQTACCSAPWESLHNYHIHCGLLIDPLRPQESLEQTVKIPGMHTN